MAIPEPNPFPVQGYDPESFCDRETELARLERALLADWNVTLIALRRMGKSALIHHLFHTVRKRAGCLYVDLHPTTDIAGLTNALASAVARHLHSRGKKMAVVLRDFARLISGTIKNGPDGVPSVELQATSSSATSGNADQLADVFRYLEAYDKRVIVAFDEFQQVASYVEGNVEEVLRSHIQRMKNTRFLFAGSNRDLMTLMFSDHARPFYQSTEHMMLGPIDTQVYSDFIIGQFAKRRRRITSAASLRVQELAERRTFHVQQLCNRLYAKGMARIEVEAADAVFGEVLGEQEHLYYGFRSMITDQQWSVLSAVAKDRVVAEPSGTSFIERNRLGSISTVRRALESLLEKELIYRDQDGYHVEDPFLAAWIRRTFV